MNSLRITLLSMSVLVASAVVSAQQAVVTALTGSATVTLPGSTDTKPIAIGDTLPEGSKVITGIGSVIVVDSFAGIQTGLSAKTTAVIGTHNVNSGGVRTVVIDLEEGTATAKLDSANKAINDYKIRTPKGVAAARGTVYTVTVVKGDKTLTLIVNTISGTVAVNVNGTAYTVAIDSSLISKNGGTEVIPTAAAATLNDPEVSKAIGISKEASQEVIKVINEIVPTVAAAANPNSPPTVVNTIIDNTDLTITVSPSSP